MQGEQRFFVLQRTTSFFWGGLARVLMSPGIKIKDHNKQMDLTFHFTQLIKVMLSKPHLKGHDSPQTLTKSLENGWNLDTKKRRQWDGIFEQLI